MKREPIIADWARLAGMGAAFAAVFILKPHLREWFTEYPMIAHFIIFLSLSGALVLLLTLWSKKHAAQKEHE